MTEENPTRLDELHFARSDAHDAYHRMTRSLDNFTYEAKRRAEEQASAAWAEQHADELIRTRAALRAAEQAVRAEEDRLAREKIAEVNTAELLYEWRSKYRWSREYEKTGRVGHLEVLTLDSVHAGNARRGYLGETVLRIVKKDGTPSAQYLRHYSMWHPEGYGPGNERPEPATKEIES